MIASRVARGGGEEAISGRLDGKTKQNKTTTVKPRYKDTEIVPKTQGYTEVSL